MPVQQWRKTIAGRELLVERGRLAGQANGSVTLTYGGTTVLATAVMGKKPREGVDFFPLQVEFEERLYAAGKIKGSRFVKREGRATDEAILSGRLIDRAIRPLFNGRMRNEIQVVVTVLSIDDDNDPDVIGLTAASLALATSDIPWGGPVAAVRIGGDATSFTVNPTYAARKTSALDIVAAGTADRINMIEAGAREVSEARVVEALEAAQKEIREIVAFQEEIVKAVSPVKAVVEIPPLDAKLEAFLRANYAKDLAESIYQKDKQDMYRKLNAVKDAFIAAVKTTWPDDALKAKQADFLFEEEINRIVHENVLTSGKRPDGRKTDELRAISCEVGVLSRTHGSSIFNRGNTQALGVLTLGSPGDEQIIENIEERLEFKKRFMLHYNFPPFAVGEIKPLRGPGRREIGHGALAERAVEPLLPPREEFPYTIRIVSEILSSNGSSSMASVCAATLALMDGGVHLKAPAAGIAMGLMTGAGGKYAVLTDIQGPEDHHGDMDFKVAGTREGITALQMDVKIDGVTTDMLAVAFAQARDARIKILDVMQSVIPAPRAEMSKYAPRVTTLRINPELIRNIIGPGGKMINQIIAETGAEIDVEDDGTVFISAVDPASMQKAVEWVQMLTREVKPGELFEKARITRLMEFGAFAEMAPKQEGLIHISEMAPWRVERVEDIVKVGDIVPVYVKEIDELGRVNLSLKQARAMLGQEQPTPPAGQGGEGSGASRGFGGAFGGPHRSGPRQGGFGGPRRDR